MYHSIHRNHTGYQETYVNPYFRRCKLLCLFDGTVRFVAITDPDFMVVHFETDPLDTVRPSFFLCKATVFQGKRRIIRTGGIAVGIVSYFFEGTFISRIIGN